MKISKNKLITINKNLTLSVDMNRREVTRLSEELNDLRHRFNEAQREVNMMRSRTHYLVRDGECFSQLNNLLSSELLTARIEIQKLRYDMRSQPDQAEVKPETLMKVAGIKK